jgi:hypothetical protein
MAAFSYVVGQRQSYGSVFKIPVRATWASSTYTSGGEPITAAKLGLAEILDVNFEDSAGYAFDAIVNTDGSQFLLKAYYFAGGNTSATSGGTPAGTVDAPTGTNAALDKVFDIHTIPYCKGASDATSSDASDQNATPTNGAYFSALQSAANTTAITMTNNVDVPRSIVVVHKNNSGAPANQIACTYAVVGTYNGAAQTEDISFADTSEVADGKFRYVFGAKPFDTVTSITPSHAQNAGFQKSAGLGPILGLPKALYTPAEADVVRITKQGADVAVTGTVNTTNHTVNVGAITDNDNIVIKYARKGYSAVPAWTSGAAPAFTGAPLATHIHTSSTSAGTELSGTVSLVIDFDVLGY